MSEAAEDEWFRGEDGWMEDILEEQWECGCCGSIIRGGSICPVCFEKKGWPFEEEEEQP